jgi:hypothetical protein
MRAMDFDAFRRPGMFGAERPAPAESTTDSCFGPM